MTESAQLYFAPFVDSLPSKSDLSLHASGAFLSKRCSKCGNKKPLSEFHKRVIYKDGFEYNCKKCRLKYIKEYIQQHPIFRQKRREYMKHWQAKNYPRDKEKRIREAKEWRNKNPKKAQEAHKRWKKNNRKKVLIQHRLWDRKKRLTLQGNLNSRISRSIQKSLWGNKNGQHWEKIIGYTSEDLKRSIESQFTDGMTWESFMCGKIHIHHIIPQYKFHYKTANDLEFKQCWALSNLQPLWVKDHIEIHRTKR